MSIVDIEIAIRPKRRGQPKDSAALPTAPHIPRITRLMALAIKFQDMVDRGELRDYADLARLGYVSRARLTQIMSLLLLAPDLQELLLTVEAPRSRPLMSEQSLRKITKLILWEDQRRGICSEYVF